MMEMISAVVIEIMGIVWNRNVSFGILYLFGADLLGKLRKLGLILT